MTALEWLLSRIANNDDGALHVQGLYMEIREEYQLECEVVMGVHRTNSNIYDAALALGVDSEAACRCRKVDEVTRFALSQMQAVIDGKATMLSPDEFNEILVGGGYVIPARVVDAYLVFILQQ